MVTAPSSIDELMQRCYRIAGFTAGELAQQLGVSLPEHLQREKGIIGQLLEQVLGAESGSKAEPDFPHLGVELKTLPINANATPLESTYVCVAPLTNVELLRFEDSWVCRKLAQVLWIPVLVEPNSTPAERVIGQGFLWRPSPVEFAQLKQDWEELMERIVLGGLDDIRGTHGEILQLRPKAANSRARTAAVGADGAPIQHLPRGFYLKASFTKQLLARAQQLA
jgi:DNA mismatch repair protein MutH